MVAFGGIAYPSRGETSVPGASVSHTQWTMPDLARGGSQHHSCIVTETRAVDKILCVRARCSKCDLRSFQPQAHPWPGFGSIAHSPLLSFLFLGVLAQQHLFGCISMRSSLLAQYQHALSTVLHSVLRMMFVARVSCVFS